MKHPRNLFTPSLMTLVAAFVFAGCGGLSSAERHAQSVCRSAVTKLRARLGPELGSVVEQKPLAMPGPEIQGCAVVYTPVPEETYGEDLPPDEIHDAKADHALAVLLPDADGRGRLHLVPPSDHSPGAVILSVDHRDATGDARKELVIQAKGEPGGVVQVWLHAYPGSASAMADSAARAIPKIRRGYEFEVLPRAKITVGAMGKVTQEIGPFDITAFDLTKNRYMVVTHIPAAYGKDCDASKPLKQHKVRQVKIWLNGKLEGTTEVVNECPMTFKGGFTSNVKPMGNTLKVEAKGKAGGWFEVSLHGQAK